MNAPVMATDPLDRFHAAVRRHPGRTAVRDICRHRTFAELDQESAGLAGALRARGIGRGDRVGVALPRSVDLLVALLAVWRAGAAYVPLDLSYPDARLAFLARDAQLGTFIAAHRAGWLPLGSVLVPPCTSDAFDGDMPVTSDPAYLIYTSGSTGEPKGVQVTRPAVALLIDALDQAGIFAPGHRVVGWNASVCFDASVQQWVRVCRGDTVIVLTDELRTDPPRLARWLAECAVTDLDLTPSHWVVLRDTLLAMDRPPRLLLGGEPVPGPVWSDIAAHAELEAVNVYGPTECTVDATAAWITGAGGPHIGRPLPGIDAYVLDDALRPVPDDTAGELYLAGPRVALGYHGRPALTAGAFLPNPFSLSGSRLYRTGDRARRTREGTLEFLGRGDRQVKIRGHRVELGEVEAALLASPGVRAAAVVVRDTPELGQHLVAYYVSESDESTVRAGLRGLLPAHMLPAAYVALSELPRTPNGKLDNAALADIRSAPGTVANRAVLPGNRPEGRFAELIAEVWADVLGCEHVGADDDFFALGGHSLVALRLVGHLRRTFGLAMPFKDVYRHPRLRDLARHIENLAGSTGPV